MTGRFQSDGSAQEPFCLVLLGRTAGAATRALAWLGPKRTTKALRTLRRKLPPTELQGGRLPSRAFDVDGPVGQRNRKVYRAKSESLRLWGSLAPSIPFVFH